MVQSKVVASAFYAEVGFRLQNLREGRGLTQDELSAEIGYTTQHYRNWEKGLVRFNLEQGLMVVRVLGLRGLDELVGPRAPKHVV
jgi:DNA-binding XRE family transcriptional regulator